MAPTKTSSIATICLTINLLSFTFVSSCNTCVFPNPRTPSTSGVDHHCPRDALKLGICANVLNGPVGAVIGSPPNHPCCSILAGLLDLEAAVCLCTAIKANILGININIPIALSLLINVCGKTLPSDFQCA